MPSRRKITLNAKELAVIATLENFKKKGRALASLSDVAAVAFRKKGSSPGTKGNSWVRNSLRRPFRLGLVAHHSRGLYFRTDMMLKDINKVVEEGSES